MGPPRGDQAGSRARPGSRRRQRSLRRGAIAGVAAVSLAVGLTLYLTDALSEPERDTIDARFELRGDQTPPDDIVVVGVDADTFRELDLRWPFPRSVHAQLLDQISADRPAATVFDVQFTEPTNPGKAKGFFAWLNSPEDFALIRAVQRAGNVVLSTTEVGANGETAVFSGNAALKSLGARAGNGNFVPDAGGVIRRLPYSIDGLPSLSVATTEMVDDTTVDPDEFDDDTLIDYAGPPGTIETVPYSTALRGETEPGFFRDKIVVIGPTAPSLQDVHPTSTTGEELMPGAEIQANAIDTVRDGLPLQPAPDSLSLLIIVLMSVAAPLSSLRVSPLRGLLGGILLAAAYLAIAIFAFNAGLVLPVISPLAALVLSVVGMLVVQYLVTALEREQVRSTFARFVPEGVVGDVMARTDDDLRLGGERRDCTILFSDIRGFTTFSETRSAEEVVEILNRYLQEMSDAILSHGGAITGYMGDGIMAVFGAPLEQPDHADRAIAAARSMLEEKLPAFNRWLTDEKEIEPFRMGIGLHSGPVMVGNVGSDQRLEYTAIGDTVNTASRLEGMTKGTPHPLYIADPTREHLQNGKQELVYVDEIAIRGRKAGIKVWTLPELRADG